jgi:type I restriction enzyme, R subunit
LLLSALREEIPCGNEYCAFDLICHVVFGQPPLTRKERAENVRKRDYFAKYGEKARLVLDALLDKYTTEGERTIRSSQVLQIPPINHLGTPVEIINQFFGGRTSFDAALDELSEALF